ncbi:PHB depolymerase family esterase [Lutimaribacter sp. EGI FJ00015]|uniref:PHB depolymerase family esterase n=1 Tax=Lutimaribacter degradans TaxID=2945989 RepID=A0ACC5ZZG8_9RHOB|nr:PHB depolymerase family esterase [Lutimaribacter sp. EGI FJ00013]MCM2563753.1 PHB depolymerase family esterase [Lutimaribacter sp. EGI FJ00013]MCO0614938.1 PHB depolymerase family esterase [Lutimaribacter sp. EGI FJ00015]MCO0637581.1 PHB depolymerase family esterase [Lutimaribacter sp. EGI FJ00014]
MKRSLTAKVRRMNRLMGPTTLTRKTRSFQDAMTGFMVDSALAPFAAFIPNAAKPRKADVSQTSRKRGSVAKQRLKAKSLKPNETARSPGDEASPRIPTGARYITRKHNGTTGSRAFKLYLPASRPKQPKGLILMLHGCDQTPDDFAVGTRMNLLAEKHGLAIAYPAQTEGHNSASCWNWFKPDHQARGAGEPAILASLTRKLMKEFGLGRESVFVAGLSSGGAMAAILADVYPDVFSAAGIHSGLSRGTARNVISAMSAMRSGGTPGDIAPATPAGPNPTRRIIFHGDTDSTVHPSNAPIIVAAAMGDEAVPTKEIKRSVRGRGYARSEYAGPNGAVLLELWMIEGASHGWSGGHAAGSYTDTKGPDASAQMVRFFLENST